MGGLGDVLCDMLGGGVEGVEGGGGVEVGVVEGGEDAGEGGFHRVKVAEEAVLVKGGAGDGEGDAPVVAMGWFEGVGDGDGVCGTKLGMDGQLVHGASIETAAEVIARSRADTHKPKAPPPQPSPAGRGGGSKAGPLPRGVRGREQSRASPPRTLLWGSAWEGAGGKPVTKKKA